MNLYDSIAELDPLDKIDKRIIQRVTDHRFLNASSRVYVPGSRRGSIKDDETMSLSAQKVPSDMRVLKLIR